jgi:hypothetical protein
MIPPFAQFHTWSEFLVPPLRSSDPAEFIALLIEPGLEVRSFASIDTVIRDS